jgi:tetratricopeptide (TPR) repeat protein
VATEAQRSRLFRLLSELPNPQFEELVFAIEVPPQNISSSSAPQGTRVGNLLAWAESPVGCGLDSVSALMGQLFGIDLRHSEIGKQDFPTNDLPQLSVQLVGREQDLVNIHEQLYGNDQSTTVAVVGMPGVGKSELALHYAHSYGHNYPGGICWVNAREEGIAVQIVQFGRRLGLVPLEDDEPTNQLRYCWQNWPNAPEPVLIVIDDADSYENQLRESCRGLTSRFRFLLTSRQYWNKPVKLVALEPPTPEQAVAIFEEILPNDPRLEEESAILLELCKWVGYLPLAIQLIGNYLALESFTSIAETLKELKENSLEDIALEDDVQRSAKSAFELSWERLSLEARCLGCLLSLFAPAPIPWPLVVDAVRDVTTIQSLRAAKTYLLRAHLLKQVNRETVQFHRLLREFFTSKIQEVDPKETYGCGICRAVVSAACKMPDKPLEQDVHAFNDIYLHAEEVSKRLSTTLSKNEATIIFISLTRYYQGQGRYERASDWAEQCLAFCRKNFGKQHPQTANAYKNAGLSILLQGKINIAITHLQEAYKLQTSLTGQNSVEVAAIQVLLAVSSREFNELDAAEQWAIDALTNYSQVYQDTHLDLAEARMTLATILFRQERDLSEIETLVTKVLTVRQSQLPDNHPDIPETLDLLAKVYERQQRYEEATPLYVEAKEVNERSLGFSHPQTAISYNNLAKNFQAQRRYMEAQELFERAVKIFQDAEILPFAGWCLRNLAMTHLAMRESDKSRNQLEAALEVLSQCLPENHPHIIQCKDDLESF